MGPNTLSVIETVTLKVIALRSWTLQWQQCLMLHKSYKRQWRKQVKSRGEWKRSWQLKENKCFICFINDVFDLQIQIRICLYLPRDIQWQGLFVWRWGVTMKLLARLSFYFRKYQTPRVLPLTAPMTPFREHRPFLGQHFNTQFVLSGVLTKREHPSINQVVGDGISPFKRLDLFLKVWCCCQMWSVRACQLQSKSAPEISLSPSSLIIIDIFLTLESICFDIHVWVGEWIR